MKRIIFVLMFAGLFALTFGQAADSTVINTLTGFGISKTVAWLIVTALGLGIGHLVVPNKWTSIFLFLEKIFQGLANLLHWFNAKTNLESKKQKAARLAKKAALVVMLVGMAGVVSAQSTKPAPHGGSSYITRNDMTKNMQTRNVTDAAAQQVDVAEPGFFEPIDKFSRDRRYNPRAVGDKSKIMLFRPAVTAQGLFIALGEKQPVTTAFNGLGLGGSYGLYTEKADGSLYCTFGVQANFWTQFQAGETVDTKMGLSVQAEFVNRFFNIGPAVYFDQGKAKIGIVYGLSYRF